MRRESKKLSLNKQTFRVLTGRQLDATKGAGLDPVSGITCDLECIYWRIFTR